MLGISEDLSTHIQTFPAADVKLYTCKYNNQQYYGNTIIDLLQGVRQAVANIANPPVNTSGFTLGGGGWSLFGQQTTNSGFGKFSPNRVMLPPTTDPNAEEEKQKAKALLKAIDSQCSVCNE